MPDDYYVRREVIELFDFEESFLEQLEAEELVNPVRAPDSREFVFTPDQVERLRVIVNLTRDLEVNLPGCGVILEMRERMMRMQDRFDRILAELLEHMKSGS